ncbi:hypothetical protein B296_00005638 [Ensete ventricosum]|uniref:Uncharacterized protein n=1 Tax=Ensete ventricosum TaxID=4639 RepID=A0A427AJX2_ENSVE|nr:hypothetical protein B296_00005638 [Ensete ventricosum]
MPIVVIEISSPDEDEVECKKGEMEAKKMATAVGRRKRREYVKVVKVEAAVDDEDEDDNDDDDDECFILPYNPFLDDQLDLEHRLYLDDPPLSDDWLLPARGGTELMDTAVTSPTPTKGLRSEAYAPAPPPAGIDTKPPPRLKKGVA